MYVYGGVARSYFSPSSLKRSYLSTAIVGIVKPSIGLNKAKKIQVDEKQRGGGFVGDSSRGKKKKDRLQIGWVETESTHQFTGAD